jgi:hypothetical protein
LLVGERLADWVLFAAYETTSLSCDV